MKAVSNRPYARRQKRIFENVLVCGSPLHDAPVMLRQILALMPGPGASVRLIELPDAPPPLPATQPEVLDRLLGSLSRLGVALHREPAAGRSGDAIVREAVAGGHDVVMKGVAVGPRGSRTLDRVDLALVRRCPCPVWFVECAQPRVPRRIVVALDPEPEDADRRRLAVRVATVAAEFAEMVEAELHALHAWLPFGEHLLVNRLSEEELRQYVQNTRDAAARGNEAIRAAAGLEFRPDGVHFVKGHFDRVLPAFLDERDFDVVVMGTKGRHGWLDSVIRPHAETALTRTRASMLVVKDV